MAQTESQNSTNSETILAVDIGTTGMKMGVFQLSDNTLNLVRQFSQEYEVNIYNDGLFGDIEQEKWKTAFIAGCKEMEDLLSDVDVISLSGTTPGLTAMDKDGQALYPAILMLDQRSRKQAQFIIETVGTEDILWIKDNYSDIFNKTYKFGHSNTYFAHWLTGSFAIDPSSASLTALYNTVQNDFTWNEDIASTFGLSLDQLPQIIPAYESVGRINKSLAQKLGLRKEPPVIIGGNDAVLAAYSVGINEPGDIINVNGTCEITLVCLDKCLFSANYNIRAHVLQGRWLTLHVMNAGGKALDWYKSLFCSELSAEEFYNNFLPKAIESCLDCQTSVTYVPYLMGSRYSLEPLKAQLLGLTQQTTRKEILAAIVKGLCEYQKAHLEEIEKKIPLKDIIHVTGGATSPSLMRAKSKWMRDSEYIHNEQSSMKGAAMLGQKYLDNR
ncbi:MAG: FGGY-family carbohydrate kinase [Planctomycetota bacterium]|jgi:sugar (pentulose or hexulose) kinase